MIISNALVLDYLYSNLAKNSIPKAFLIDLRKANDTPDIK